MSDTLSISDARAQLPRLVDQVATYVDRITITVKGKAKAVLVNPEELESLEETAEILTISGAKEAILRGKKEIENGKYISLTDLS